MPDADDYLRRANAVLALSLRAANPVVAARFFEVAQDYLARAVALRLEHGLSALPHRALRAPIAGQGRKS